MVLVIGISPSMLLPVLSICSVIVVGPYCPLLENSASPLKPGHLRSELKSLYGQLKTFVLLFFYLPLHKAGKHRS